MTRRDVPEVCERYKITVFAPLASLLTLANRGDIHQRFHNRQPGRFAKKGAEFAFTWWLCWNPS